MIHLLSALIVGSIYGGAYSFGVKENRIYRLSIALLALLLVSAIASILWEVELVAMLGEDSWVTFDYTRNIIVHSLWLQSLICTSLSVVGLVNQRQRRYLAGACVFCMMFLALAYANSNGGTELAYAIIR